MDGLKKRLSKILFPFVCLILSANTSLLFASQQTKSGLRWYAHAGYWTGRVAMTLTEVILMAKAGRKDSEQDGNEGEKIISCADVGLLCHGLGEFFPVVRNYIEPVSEHSQQHGRLSWWTGAAAHGVGVFIGFVGDTFWYRFGKDSEKTDLFLGFLSTILSVAFEESGAWLRRGDSCTKSPEALNKNLKVCL